MKSKEDMRRHCAAYRARKEAATPGYFKIKLAEWRKNNPDRLRMHRRGQYVKLREEMFRNYGMSCSCCGETEIGFLTLEHLDRSVKKIIKGRGSNQLRLLKKLGWPKSAATVMCANCNFARRDIGSQCPHAAILIDVARRMPA